MNLLFKNKFLIGVVITLLLLLGTTTYYYKQYQRSVEELKLSVNNNKAYSKELGNIKGENIQFQFTIEQLRYFNDSINDKLLNTSKKLGIKESKIKSLQYLLTVTSRTDTIDILQRDTIFKDDSINIDTIIGDQWYTLKLGLRYPNKILTEPTFKSEKTIITYDRKETINPPKKFLLLRWFQKKHKVRIVEVHEGSPYVKDSLQRFIEIIK